MPDGMALADLVHDLRGSLQDAAGAFSAADGADFVRHLRVAAEAFAVVRPRTTVGSVVLVAEQDVYSAPADLWRFKSAIWGVRRGQPWERSWPGRLPDVRVVDGTMVLTPAPTGHQIAVLGAEYRFFYYARHVLGAEAAETTIAPEDRGLLLLRAQAEAMRELAIRDSVRPVTARDAYGGMPRSGVPSALFRAFLDEFERAVR